jgi:hypothetical protein
MRPIAIPTIVCLSLVACDCGNVRIDRVVEVYPNCSTASLFSGPAECRVRLASGEHRTVNAPVATGDCLAPSVLGGEATLVVPCPRNSHDEAS